MKKQSWKIYWNEYSSDAYIYGSEIIFHAKNDVEYTNELIPPGTVIKTWHSKVNYQSARTEPTLPMIDGEGKYRISFDITSENENSIIFKIVYYDRYDVEFDSEIIRGNKTEFKCPLRTFSYDVQLINSGLAKFNFHSITITEIEDVEQ